MFRKRQHQWEPGSSVLQGWVGLRGADENPHLRFSKSALKAADCGVCWRFCKRCKFAPRASLEWCLHSPGKSRAHRLRRILYLDPVLAHEDLADLKSRSVKKTKPFLHQDSHSDEAQGEGAWLSQERREVQLAHAGPVLSSASTSLTPGDPGRRGREGSSWGPTWGPSRLHQIQKDLPSAVSTRLLSTYCMPGCVGHVDPGQGHTDTHGGG